jgi:hypothetical protein
MMYHPCFDNTRLTVLAKRRSWKDRISEIRKNADKKSIGGRGFSMAYSF